MKPFKWIKKHPWESAAIAAALIATGGTAAGWFGPAAAAGEAAAGAGAASAAGASVGGTVAAETAAELASLYGSELGLGAAGAGAGVASGMTNIGGSLLGTGTLPSYGANAISSLLGPSDFTAAMAGDAYMPGALGPSGTGTASMGSKMGSLLASKGGGMSPKEAMMLAQMMGYGQQPQQPMGAPEPMGQGTMQRQAMMTQEQITKKWLLQNDPNTYARIYGAPQGASYG